MLPPIKLDEMMDKYEIMPSNYVTAPNSSGHTLWKLSPHLYCVRVTGVSSISGSGDYDITINNLPNIAIAVGVSYISKYAIVAGALSSTQLRFRNVSDTTLSNFEIRCFFIVA